VNNPADMGFEANGVAARLILGAAQFGMPYGVTNQRGQIELPAANEIISYALAAGVELVDTAAAYGASELVLGQCLSKLRGMGVITKTLAVSQATVDATEIQRLRRGVSRSLELLRLSRLNGLLLHQGSDLLKPGGDRLAEFLIEQKSNGAVAKIGVSVYDGSEIDRILRVFRPDIVQLPLNLFDQRLIRSGHIGMLREAGVEIHARSAFLQGVLLADLSRMPAHFRRFEDCFSRYRKFLDDNLVSPLRACIGFMIEQSGVDRIVVGVTGKDELADIVSALTTGNTTPLPPMDELACFDERLIDPRTWPLAGTQEGTGS
jgi:hypothetical protein